MSLIYFNINHLKILKIQKYKPTVEEESEAEEELNIQSDDEFIKKTFIDNENETQKEEHEISDSNKYFF